jgi:hypothetical protein
LVPGANAFGLFSQSLRFCQSQVAALGLERVGEGEAVCARADALAEHAPQIRTERVRAALRGVVAGGALLEHVGALRRIGAGEVEGDRLVGGGGGAGIASSSTPSTT